VTSAADARKPFTLGGKRRAQRPDQTGRRTQMLAPLGRDLVVG
jgi:hypothetical protein